MKKPRICLVVPELLKCSGLTQISLTLIKYCPVEWVGVVCTWGAIDYDIAEQFSKIAPVYVVGDFEDNIVVSCSSLNEAVKRGCRNAEIIATSSFYKHNINDLPPIAQTFQAQALPYEVEQDIISKKHTCNWISASSHSAARYLEALGLKNIAVIPNAIDPDRLKIKKGRKAQRKIWGIKEDEIAVGYIGRHHWEKNPTALIRALPYLPNGFKGIYYGNDTHTGQISKELVAMADFLAPGKVQFHLPSLEIADIFSGLDVVVLPSYREGISIAFLEAMSLGTPVVATRVGGSFDLEQKYGEIACFIDIDPSGKELADSIEKTIKNNKSQVAKAKNLMLEELSVYSYGEKWYNYYCGLVKEVRKNKIMV